MNYTNFSKEFQRDTLVSGAKCSNVWCGVVIGSSYSSFSKTAREMRIVISIILVKSILAEDNWPTNRLTKIP